MECDSDAQLWKNPRRIIIPFTACPARLRILAILAIVPTTSIVSVQRSSRANRCSRVISPGAFHAAVREKEIERR